MPVGRPHKDNLEIVITLIMPDFHDSLWDYERKESLDVGRSGVIPGAVSPSNGIPVLAVDLVTLVDVSLLVDLLL